MIHHYKIMNNNKSKINIIKKIVYNNQQKIIILKINRILNNNKVKKFLKIILIIKFNH